jgi:hypothetical protein
MGISQYIPALQFGSQPTEQVPKEVLKYPIEFRRLSGNDLVAFFIPPGATITSKVPYYSTRTGYQTDGLTLGALYGVTQAATALEAEYTLRSMYAFKVLRGRVPQPADVADPYLTALVLEYEGVRVYRTWENRRGQVYSSWGYAVEGDHDAADWEDTDAVFDIGEHLDFSGYQGDKPIPLGDQLRYAIDTGQITRRGVKRL